MDAWRQWIRHRTANINEYSTRYSIAIDASQKTSPNEWRIQATDNKQGSDGFLENEIGNKLTKREEELQNLSREVYQERLKIGVAREQARKDLPLSTYTEAYWKVDLHNLLHFLELRMDSHAQYEIRAFANVIGNEIVSRWCPIAWEAFKNYYMNSLNLSSLEISFLKSIIAGQKEEVLKEAENANARVVLVGDTKQHQSISAGRMFEKLQETGDLSTVRMSEVIRQKDADYKAIVTDISEKRIADAFEKLESQRRIVEIHDRQDRLNEIVKDYTSREDFKNTLIVTAGNRDRNELNSAIRDELKNQGKLTKEEYTFTVRESKNLNPSDRHFAQSYQARDIVISSRAGLIGRAGSEARVTSVDQQQHKITVETKDGQEHVIDVKTKGQDIQVYTEKQQSFSQGDKVVFLKNDRGLKIQNGQVGEIKSVTADGRARVEMGNGREKTINLQSQYSYVDSGYAVTSYKSQGQTSKEVLVHMDMSKETSFNELYVSTTRGKDDLKIYTSNKEVLKEQVKEEQIKTSTLDYYKKDYEKPESDKAETHDKAESHESHESHDHDKSDAREVET